MLLGVMSVLGTPSELLLYVLRERRCGGKNNYLNGYYVGIYNLRLTIGKWIFGNDLLVQTNIPQDKTK